MLTTTFVFTLLNLIPPLLQKVMIDDVITKFNLDLLKWIVLAIFAVQLLSSVFMGLRNYQLSWLGQKLSLTLESRFTTTFKSSPYPILIGGRPVP